MRILTIRFKNLNSLCGEWELDLTHPAYASEGLFAITGPTGAGKTTILDALCLALYGRTPRLSRINKSQNELMSRQSGDCFAEVTFETQAGRYRCHWSQRRARNKPTGELQVPRHEIADAQTNAILETQLRAVSALIEEVTGMSFDRFTRSMLLAQGGFAAFLQAGPDERAPILEQMTGTEIYSKLSIQVHERRSEERKKLELLQAQMKGIQLLAEEEEARLSQLLEELISRDKEWTQAAQEYNRAISWIEGITHLEEELKGLIVAEEQLALKEKAMAPQLQKLSAATRAMEHMADHRELVTLRREVETQRKVLETKKGCFASCKAALEKAESELKAAENQEQTQKAEQIKRLPLIQRARLLNTKLSEKQPFLDELSLRVKKLEDALDKAKEELSQTLVDGKNKRQACSLLLEQLAQTQGDEILLEQLTGLCSRGESLQELERQVLDKGVSYQLAEQQCLELLRAFDGKKKNLSPAQNHLAELQSQLEHKEYHLHQLLEGIEPRLWRQRQQILTQKQMELNELCGAVEKKRQGQRVVEELVAREGQIQQARIALMDSLEQNKHRQELLEQEKIELIQRQKIASFEEARHELKEGEACPLCGAKEHPFILGLAPHGGNSERIQTVRGELQRLGEEMTELKLELMSLSKDFEQVLTEKRQREQEIKAAEEWLSVHGVEGDVKAQQEKNSAALEHVQMVLEKVEDQELSVLKKAVTQTQEAVRQQSQDLETLALKQEVAKAEQERLRKEEQVLTEQMTCRLAELQKDLQPLGVTLGSPKEWKTVLETLTARCERRKQLQEEKRGLDGLVVTLELQLTHKKEQIVQLEAGLNEEKTRLGQLACDRDLLDQERQQIMGQRDPDEEEAHWVSAVLCASECVLARRREHDVIFHKSAQLIESLREVEGLLIQGEEQLVAMQARFYRQLEKSGFSDEESYCASCLPEEERRALAVLAQDLIKERSSLITQLQDRQGRLEEERQKKWAEEGALGELREKLENQQAEHKGLQQQVGSLRQKLCDNARLKEEKQACDQAFLAQREEWQRWDHLHQLIGSADGKKYRNFAQGLTFELMIGHANRQLQKMSDRYLLVRDQQQFLELNVIDNYQGSKVRSTKNLSGGESFLVSLSLALGLSHMASKSVCVDSLFLDEGFGTLDDDALDTALETLASLQREGKLIGVISHVPALKERIATQIQVHPTAGGRSILSGPGCRMCT